MVRSTAAFALIGVTYPKGRRAFARFARMMGEFYIALTMG
jgi:hypothetical protein